MMRVFSRDCHYEWIGRAILVIQGRNTSPIITHPDDAVGGCRHAPGIDQVSIDMLGHAGDVGLKVFPAISVSAGLGKHSRHNNRC